MPRHRQGASQEPGEGGQQSGGSAPLERFTSRAQKVLAGAVDEARRLNHPAIGPEHLVLAMVRDETATGTAGLRRLGAEPAAVAAEIERAFPPGHHPLETAPELSEAAQSIVSDLVRANAGARSLVGTAEMLNAIFREGGLSEVWVALGFRRWGESRRGRRLLRYQDVAEGPRDNVITLRVSERDADAVDALVEVGIMRTRSEAAAWLLHAGIGANEPLFEKVRGLMAEIRGLREEAQRLAQEHTSQPATESPPTQ